MLLGLLLHRPSDVYLDRYWLLQFRSHLIFDKPWNWFSIIVLREIDEDNEFTS